MKQKIEMRKPIVITMLVLYIAIIVVGLVSPASFAAAEGAIVNFAASWFGWLYDLTALALVAVCVWMLFSKKYGAIKIGGKMRSQS